MNWKSRGAKCFAPSANQLAGRCAGPGPGQTPGHMARAVNERLDSATHRVGQSMEQTMRTTMDSLRVLHERLGIIDHAQQNLSELTSQAATLRDSTDKQSRGAFGQLGRKPRPGRHAQAPTNAVHPYQLASGRTASCFCPMPGRCASMRSFRSRRSPLCTMRGPTRRGDSHPAAARRRPEACQRHRGEVPDRRRDPGYRAEVGAVGLGVAEIHDGSTT